MKKNYHKSIAVIILTVLLLLFLTYKSSSTPQELPYLPLGVIILLFGLYYVGLSYYVPNNTTNLVISIGIGIVSFLVVALILAFIALTIFYFYAFIVGAVSVLVAMLLSGLFYYKTSKKKLK